MNKPIELDLGDLSNVPHQKTYPLDIRELKQTGPALHREIEDMVSQTQAIIERPLPDEIIMTKAQFDDLVRINMPRMADTSQVETEDRMYITRGNIMEVKVKELESA